eukprot:1185214-Prorocentrum_minimum.AAC.1
MRGHHHQRGLSAEQSGGMPGGLHRRPRPVRLQERNTLRVTPHAAGAHQRQRHRRRANVCRCCAGRVRTHRWCPRGRPRDSCTPRAGATWRRGVPLGAAPRRRPPPATPPPAPPPPPAPASTRVTAIDPPGGAARSLPAEAPAVSSRCRGFGTEGPALTPLGPPPPRPKGREQSRFRCEYATVALQHVNKGSVTGDPARLATRQRARKRTRSKAVPSHSAVSRTSRYITILHHVSLSRIKIVRKQLGELNSPVIARLIKGTVFLLSHLWGGQAEGEVVVEGGEGEGMEK